MNIINKIFDHIGFPFVVIMNILILTGCSSVYTVNDFPTKTKFYEKFNDSIKNETIQITLLNDSSFIINTDAVLENDTLFLIKKCQLHKESGLAISEIDKILSNSSNISDIIKKNGQSVNGENIKTNNDSIYFYVTQDYYNKEILAPINNIKIISYKNRLVSSAGGILLGGGLGFLSAAWYSPTLDKNKDDPGLVAGTIIGGAIIGALIGGTVGYLGGI
jgi:hypothetical protein